MADGYDTSRTDEIIRRARAAVNRNGPVGDVQGSVIGNTLKDVKEGVENIKAVKATADEAKGAWQVVKQLGLAVWHFVNKLWPVRAYKWTEKKLTTKLDKESGERKVTRPKLRIGMRLATAFMLSAMIPGMIGMPARNTMEIGVDSFRMGTSLHTEVVRLNDTKNTADENVWSVTGNRFENGQETPMIWKVKTSIPNDIWSLTHTGNPVFYPDDVTAPVAPGANDLYRITTYGQRWRVADWLQAFPQIVQVQKLTPQEAADFNAAAQRQQAATQAPAAQQHAPAQQQPAPSR
ncbi:MAG TPA: hypothetical protein VEF76_12080 [Patescibacteria group bacterium]|nr:hypothetical protein [Patescibacteria group bacterium]